MRGIIKIFCPYCHREKRMRTVREMEEFTSRNKDTCIFCDELLEIEVVIENE